MMTTHAAQFIDQVHSDDGEAEKVQVVSTQEFCSSRPRRAFTLLVVSADEEDYRAVRRISHLLDWGMHRVSSCQGVPSFLAQDEVTAVMCDCHLPDGTWKDGLRKISPQPGSPAIVVASHLADGRTWAEVLNLEAYDLLAKPWDTKELVRARGLGWRL